MNADAKLSGDFNRVPAGVMKLEVTGQSSRFTADLGNPMFIKTGVTFENNFVDISVTLQKVSQ
ncbi:MAG: hypothetical protein IPL01_14220 [Acidobacteria bacterium]|nr:hypothetical protein [Acidobacteriota bacterium]